MDAYFEPVFPDGHPLQSLTAERMAYWKQEFGADRYGNPKAILELNFPDLREDSNDESNGTPSR